MCYMSAGSAEKVLCHFLVSDLSQCPWVLCRQLGLSIHRTYVLLAEGLLEAIGLLNADNKHVILGDV